MQTAVKYTPANQLGGDVYDFYRLEENRLGVLVADVSGHGVNSAMLSGMVKALSVGLSIAVLEPGELLAGLDVSLEQYFPEGYFCTGFYLIADEETGLVRYAGVGHPPAIVIGPNGTRTLDSNPGLLGVGMVDGTAGSVDRIGPGESLVIYTDGLPDAMDPSDVLFGEERLKTILQAHHGADPATILDEVEKAVNKHTPSPARPPTTSTWSSSSIRRSERLGRVRPSRRRRGVIAGRCRAAGDGRSGSRSSVSGSMPSRVVDGRGEVGRGVGAGRRVGRRSYRTGRSSGRRGRLRRRGPSRSRRPSDRGRPCHWR